MSQPTTSTAAPPALVVTRTVNASRERVFAAWTDAHLLAQWYAPAPDFITQAESDPRPGGSYRIVMTHPSGKVLIVGGTYREVQPPARLVYTWAWEKGPFAEPMNEQTIVTIELRSIGSTTELTMTHELLPTLEFRQQHEQGWNGVLNRLAGFLNPNASSLPEPPQMSR